MNADLLDREDLNEDQLAALDGEDAQRPGPRSILTASRMPVDLAGPESEVRSAPLTGSITADPGADSIVPVGGAKTGDAGAAGRPSVAAPIAAIPVSRSATGGPITPAAPAVNTSRPLAGPIQEAEPRSVTGIAPIVNEPMPQTLPEIPGVNATPRPDLAADVAAGNVAAPQWSEYKPKKVGLGRKVLGMAIAGLAGMGNPAEGTALGRSIVYGPQLENFKAANEEFNTAMNEGKQREAATENELKDEETQATANKTQADAAEANARAYALKNPATKNGLTADEQTFDDLMRGNKGAPQINPDTGKPYTALEANRAVKALGQTGKRFTDPFEAFTYGTADEKKAAQDFLTFEKKNDARYQKPDEIEARYSLYKRDPQAYMAMFGNRDAAQDSRDQAQAARMLKYFDGQRKSIQGDFTLGDAEKQAQLDQIDQLEQPYLGIAQPQGAQGGNTAASRGGRGNAPRYKVGDTVTYKGQQMRVSGVRKDGKLELQPMGGGQ